MNAATRPRHTVLVVDDEPDILVSIRLVLRTGGHRILEAASGTEALELLEREQPQAMILDLRMPGLDGWDLLERMQEQSLLSRIPTMVLTAFVDPETRASLGRFAPLGFMTKPFDPEELMRAVDDLIERGT